ncbi:hypothetical protein Agub_g3901 [Astrephomene gubernaculifera]|uniref:TIR domain-containing protein n=1 Tax=Astrephomene gubernaculifera TaxID=47775 RepID=A0AAD3HJR5_9CHLO|nr:hypothetical protein Agub_g3901 [Astrephomene gubernaculifera]
MGLGIQHSARFVLFLSASTFKSAYVRFEIQTALRLGKPTLVLHDPDPASPAHTDLQQQRAAAPPALRPILEGPCLAWPSPGADLDAFVRQVMQVCDFGGHMAAPGGSGGAAEVAAG